MHTCRYHLHNLFYGKDPTDYLSVNEKEIKLSLDNSVESRWRELKAWLKKHPNQIHYMGAATIESVVKKMEELEEK